VQHLKYASLGLVLVFLINIRLGCTSLPGTKHSSLLRTFVKSFMTLACTDLFLFE
jgi:hypothetical protein